MNMTKRLIIATVLLIIAVSATAAAGVDMIRIADPSGDYGYPTPHGHYSRGSGYIQMSLIFDTLVWKDVDGFVPALADSWSYDEGENAYTFTLNRDAKWTDGTDFTAEDVRFTIGYFKEHPYLWADLASVETCEVVDPDTAKIILKELYAPFITEIAGSMPILPEHVWKEVDDPANFVDERALIGTGPYMLEDYSREHSSYLYHANHGYYRGEPKFEKVVFIKAKDGQVALMNGDADMAPVKPEAIETLETNGFTAVYGSCFWNHKLMINHHKEPFSRTEFRQALAYGINRTELVEKAGRGYGSEASLGFLPPESDWYTDDQPAYDYNPKKAGELLESLGYQLVDGVYEKDGEKLQLELSIIAKETKLAEILKIQLTALGIPTTVSALELTTLDSQVKNWNFDIALSRHGLLKADPKTLINLLHGNTSWSARYFENEELNDKLEEQLHEMDKDKRTEIVHDIQKLCAEDLPAIALYYPDYYYAASDKTEWYFTKEGIANGLRLPLNKLSLIQDSDESVSAETEVDAPEESDSESDPASASTTETPTLPALAVLAIVFAAYLMRR